MFILPQFLKRCHGNKNHTYCFMEMGREKSQCIIKMTIYNERSECSYLCFSVILNLCPEVGNFHD